MTKNNLLLQQQDAKHHLHPFSDFKYMKSPNLTRIIDSADGVYIYNQNGDKIIDAMSGLWCVNMGYGQRAIIDAVNEQMEKLIYYNTFFGTSHAPAAKLAQDIAGVTAEHMNNVFFTGSGSEANDTMIRMARYYWSLKGRNEKTIIISRKNAYHGSTMAGASLGGMDFMHAQGGLPIADIVHIEQPYHYGACVTAGALIDEDEFGKQMALRLEDKIIELGKDKIAAFIAEPIQGAGGVIIPPKTYWPEINRICKEYDILLVADEVICGFGRTGEWFGSDYYDIKPDIMPFAKGVSSGYLPIGGIIVSDEIVSVMQSAKQEFAHGYTYSGHPSCCVAASANIKLMQDTDILSKVKQQAGPYLAKKWQTLSEHPLVGQARSLGMLGALEIIKDKDNFVRFENSSEVTAICRDFCFDNGLVMRAVGDKMIIAPPLVCTNEHIDEITEKAWKCLDLTLAAIK